MEWISRVVRGTGGRLQVKVARDPNVEEVVDLAKIRGGLSVVGIDRVKVTLSLKELNATNARHFLDQLGAAWASDAGQPVYEAPSVGVALQIPAQLLILALFGTHRDLRDRILTPLPPAALKSVLMPAKTGTALANTLDWISRDPSAAESWSSVYQNALRGRFDLTLPEASATLSARGRLHDGKLLVTQLRLLCLEASLTTAVGPSGSPDRASHSFRRTMPLTTDSRLDGLSEPPRLSDNAWAELAPLVDSPRRDSRGLVKSYDYRELVNVMLHKMALGVPWADMPGDRRVIRRASEVFPHLARVGVLDHAVALLAGHTSASRTG